jgi:hypothetical protein
MKFAAVRHPSVGAGKEKRVEKSLEISAPRCRTSFAANA